MLHGVAQKLFGVAQMLSGVVQTLPGVAQTPLAWSRRSPITKTPPWVTMTLPRVAQMLRGVT
jgi:hypothetical protein